MKIDIHNHFTPDSFVQEMEKRGTRYEIRIKRNPDGFGTLIQHGDTLHTFTKDFTDPIQRLKDMDAAGIDKAAISRANADTGTHSVSCEPSVTPIPAIPPDWKKVSIPGSSLTFGLPSDWEISESKASRVTARKNVPTSDSASTKQFMKDLDKYGA